MLAGALLAHESGFMHGPLHQPLGTSPGFLSLEPDACAFRLIRLLVRAMHS